MTKEEARAARAMGEAIEQITAAVGSYAAAYRVRHDGSLVGNDGVLGDLGVAPILAGLRELLNGEFGPLDGATLDREILKVANKAGIAEEDL